MNRTLTAAVVLALLMLPTGCSEDSPDDPGTTSQPSTPAPVSSETATDSPLEGVWRAEITEEAFAAAIVEAGYPEDVVAEALTYLPGPEFRLEFLGERFRMSYVPEDEQYQAGTFSVDGDRITIDDEAPVGIPAFPFAVDGDELTFEPPSDEADLDPVGVGFWASTTWVRE